MQIDPSSLSSQKISLRLLRNQGSGKRTRRAMYNESQWKREFQKGGNLSGVADSTGDRRTGKETLNFAIKTSRIISMEI